MFLKMTRHYDSIYVLLTIEASISHCYVSPPDATGKQLCDGKTAYKFATANNYCRYVGRACRNSTAEFGHNRMLSLVCCSL